MQLHIEECEALIALDNGERPKTSLRHYMLRKLQTRTQSEYGHTIA